jgi:hypothetical protein
MGTGTIAGDLTKISQILNDIRVVDKNLNSYLNTAIYALHCAVKELDNSKKEIQEPE